MIKKSLFILVIIMGLLGQSFGATQNPTPSVSQNPADTAQPTTPTTTAAPNTNSNLASAQSAQIEAAPASEVGYRIGVGDILTIKVYGVEQLSGEFRVDNRGFVSLPRITEPIAAQCLAESDLAKIIEGHYSKYLRNPHVDVAVKEYQSVPVAVIGAVKQAGRFQLRRRVKLLELLTYAGGTTDLAGTTINIVHNDDLATCSVDKSRPDFESVPIEALYRNEPQANFYVQPGDIVNIPLANIITVAGNVIKPGAQPIIGQLTLTKAIALAGGFRPDTAKTRIRIIRQKAGAPDQEITVDYEAIEKKRAKDIELLSNDIALVPDSNSTLKTFGRTMLNALGVGVGTFPITVIP
jgi:polysaccharide export outer membrane protein